MCISSDFYGPSMYRGKISDEILEAAIKIRIFIIAHVPLRVLPLHLVVS